MAASAAVAVARSVAAANSAMAAARLQHCGCCSIGGSVTARRRRQLGGGAAAAAASAAVVVAARSAAAAHSATVAAWWQQHGGCGGFTGTVRECADARAFERHRRTDVRAFVLGRGWRDDSADGIVVVGSDGGARGDVHCGRRCAATRTMKIRQSGQHYCLNWDQSDVVFEQTRLFTIV